MGKNSEQYFTQIETENIEYENYEETLDISLYINTLKNYKATGIDGIPVELIKMHPNILIDLLCILFNKIWLDENGLNEWNDSIIIKILACTFVK